MHNTSSMLAGRSFSTGLMLLACLVALATFGCGDSLKSEKAPILKFQPEPPVFSFPKLKIGEASDSSDQVIALQNIGAGTLVLVDFEIDFDTEQFDLFYYLDEAEDRQVNAVVGGDNTLGDRVEIEPGHSLTFVLNYHPTVDEAAGGALRFRTNDAKYANAELLIASEDRAPEITVTPGALDFGRVAVGSVTEAQEVTVSNIGQEPLVFEDVRLSGVGFHVNLGDVDVTENPEVLADPDGDGIAGLAPDSNMVLSVTFENTVEGPAEGLLAILSNDPESPTVNVKLTANGASPCIRVSPMGEEGLAFGGVQIDGSLQRAITIESCGGQPLRIESIAMTDDSDGAIALVADSVPALPALMPAMTLGQPLPNRNIKLECSPTEASAYGGWVEVVSNDPVNSSVRVRVTCLGVLNACPRPAVAQDTFRVAPNETVLLDATPSRDEDGPEGKPVKYRWVVFEGGPDGSSTRAVERLGADPRSPLTGATEDDLSTPTARLYIDVVGEYTVHLFVMDNLDQEAPSENCPEPIAVVHITAESDEDIHIEMSWHTPGDMNETDTTGSDVDIHMLHPRGQRWSTQLDCYYANPNPDWGMIGDPADNPALDLDDINGAGPENVSLSNPEDTDMLGGPYRVGVDYYRQESLSSFTGYGSSFVTVRIYLGGQLAWQNDAPKELQRTHDFWEVAEIIWTEADRRVRVVDHLN